MSSGTLAVTMAGSDDVARTTGDLTEIRLQTDNAREHIAVGSRVAAGARLGFAKRLVLRLADGIIAEQAEYNRSVVEALTGLEARLAEVGQALLVLQATLATEGVREASPDAHADGGAGLLEHQQPGAPTAGS